MRVTVVTVRGASTGDPNGTMANIDITPGTATATKTVSIGSSAGARYPERTNVMFYSAGQTARQNRLELEPTYGAGQQSPPYTQWFDVGHITTAVR